MKRRVVVTGLGLITPLGNTVEATWAGLMAGRSGAGPITDGFGFGSTNAALVFSRFGVSKAGSTATMQPDLLPTNSSN